MFGDVLEGTFGDVLDDVFGAVESPLAAADPVAFGRSLARALQAAARHPATLLAVSARGALGAAMIAGATFNRTIGRPTVPPIAPAEKDRRFADRAYSENPYYFLLQQLYLLNADLLRDLVAHAGLDDSEQRKAEFALGFLLDAASPTNTVVGNPAALRKAIDTGGQSLFRGLRNMIGDVRHNGGWPSQVDSSGFKVGVNMATTPGKIVYRSRLIEVLQYEAQTSKVYAVPLLFCPPWINKYYIMDLAPDKSLIEWAVRHGHTCFAISYRNPDESLRDLSFEDYLFEGPLDAVRVVREITGAPQVNTLSVCLGGTLTAIALAHNARVGDNSIKSAAFLNTHTDFSTPGVLGAFTDEAAVDALEQRMAKKGYLDAKDMARTFDAIRANDLVFQYVVNNWLMGESPPAFDLLAWNNDSTRMPAKMHTAYLRSCYVANDFAEGRFSVSGEIVDPGDVSIDTFVLSAIDDHIVPWQSAYKTAQLLGGRNTFVLSTSGHIAGIVNPPSPKAKHWTNGALPADPAEWLAGATIHSETWWEPWTRWIAKRAGRKVNPPRALGSATHPPLGDAPGTYVHLRA